MTSPSDAQPVLRTGALPVPAVRFAESEAERHAAFRLRYAVFCEEEGDQRYADHSTREYRDAKDAPDSNLVVCVNPESEVVGTLRVLLRRDGAFLGDDQYRWPQLAQRLGTQSDGLLATAALMDRCVVRRDYRRAGVFAAMSDFVDRWARENGSTVMLSFVSDKNARMHSIILKLGYSTVGIEGEAGSWRGQLYAKPL